jgi:hypothetical protein
VARLPFVVVVVGCVALAPLSGCEAPRGDGVDVVEEMIDVGLWAGLGLVENMACDGGCLLANMLEYERDDEGRILQTATLWVVDPGTSGLEAGELVCTDVHLQAPIDFGERDPDPDLRWVREYLPLETGCVEKAGWTLEAVVASEIAVRDADGSPAVASWWPLVELGQPFPGWQGEFEAGVRGRAFPFVPCPVERRVDGGEYCTSDCVIGRRGEDACELPTYTGPQ